MPWCEQCGTEVAADARFCGNCGRARPVRPPAHDPSPQTRAPDPMSPPGAPRPPATPRPAAARSARPPSRGAPAPRGGGPGGAGAGLPSWIADDWVVAIVASLIVLGVCLAFGVIYGAILGFAGTTEPGGLVSGALTGAYLPFAMFGIAVTAGREAGDATFGYVLRTLPLPLLAVPIIGLFEAIRFAWPRVVRRPPNLVAFVVKVALLVTVAATILASLLSIGDVSDAEGFGGDAGFVSKVSAGNAALYPFIILVIAGLGLLVWRRVPIWGGRVNRFVDSDVFRSAAWGAAAFAAVAAALSVIVLIADVVVADDGKQRLSTVVGFFATGLNRGVAAAVFAMGGAVARFATHTSLFHWGSYETPGDGNAPVPLFLLLAAAPAALAFVTLRRFDHQRPRDEQIVLKNAAAIAGGFVLTSWILSLLTREDFFEGSPRAAFGLGLLWALIACGAAAAVWTQRNGIRWQTLQPRDGGNDWVEHEDWQPTEAWDAPAPRTATPTPTPPPAYREPDPTYPVPEPTYRDPEPPAPTVPAETWTPAPPPPVAGRTRPAQARTCANCGAASDGSRFCRTCGAEVGPARP